MTNRGVDEALRLLGEGRQGWFTALEAERAGADHLFVRRRLRSGLLESGHPGVYRPAWYPSSFLGDLWGAHLAAGPASYVSHEAAAHLHRLAGFQRPHVVFTIPHPGHARVRGATVHQLTDTSLHEFTRIDGLPVTTIPWTFVDLAGSSSKARVRYALDDTIGARRTTAEEVGRCLATVARPRKPGALMLARLLDRHVDGPVPSSSVLERALFGAMHEAGITGFAMQYPHPGRVPGPARVDGCDPDAKLIVEADGRRWHTRIADMKRDRDRDNEAAAAGYDTLRFMHEDVVADLVTVLATIRRVQHDRVALFAAAKRGFARQ